MTPPLLVLVHGANHQRICWQPTIEVLQSRMPAGQILAVDLPGRGTNTVAVDSISINSCVTSVVDQINETTTGEIVLVGHSLGGVVACGVAATLGPTCVNHLVLVAAAIPPEGKTVLDTFGLSLRLTVPWVARRGRLTDNPRWTASRSFCNGMSDQHRAFVLDNLCPDAPWLLTEPVSRAGLSRDIERTWVLTTLDSAVSVKRQRRNIANLGGVDHVIEIEACHDVMVSNPTELADIITVCWSAEL